MCRTAFCTCCYGAKAGVAVVCALHQVDLARRWTDRVVALRGGRHMLDSRAADFDEAAFRALYGVTEEERLTA